MLTPDCKPHQIARDDNQAAWSAHNEKTGQTYVALFNLSEEVQIVNADIESIIGQTADVYLSQTQDFP